MNKKYALINKKVGETPLEAQEKFRLLNNISKNIKLAYAGRLDPMAEGKLLILIGDECKKQHSHYIGLDKEYEFEILVGFGSDTGDTLGIATPQKTTTTKSNKKNIFKVAKEIIGDISLPYPIYSSKTVHGKPLFQWTLENQLEEIVIPTAHTKIYKLKYLDSRHTSARNIQSEIFSKINRITKVTEKSKALGRDFRREDIKSTWKSLLEKNNTEYAILKFRCICSSGTYIRSLAPLIAHELGEHGLAYSIKRTKIGRYKTFLNIFSFWVYSLK
jgi:tRNA pseudouridine(55) synthase